MELTIDLTDKDNWTLQRAPDIARAFDYELTMDFVAALEEYIKEVVTMATVDRNLQPCAKHHFGEYQPPLTKVNNSR